MSSNTMYFLPHLPIYRVGSWINPFRLVDCCCQNSAAMACSEHGHSLGFLFHSQQCDLPRDFHAWLSRTGRITSFLYVRFAQSCLPRILNQSPRVRHGCTIALLLACGCELRLLWEARTRGTRADSILSVRYSTMDNIDGKQARRTGQSSGLGELFEYDTSFGTSTKTRMLT